MKKKIGITIKSPKHLEPAMKSKEYKWRVEETLNGAYAIYFIAEEKIENGLKIVGSQLTEPVKNFEDAKKIASLMFYEVIDRMLTDSIEGQWY